MAGFYVRGLELHPDRRRHRHYHSLLGFRFGPWAALPPVAGVTLKPFSFTTPGGSRGFHSHQSQSLVVLLSLQGETVGLVLKRFLHNEKRDATLFAQRIAAFYTVPLHNRLPGT